MAEDLYGLTLADVERLKLVIAQVLGDQPTQPRGRRPRDLGYEDVIFGTLDGAATATTALTGKLYSATMSVYTFTTTGGTTDTGRNETVWNAAKMQADTGRWTVARRISANWEYVIIFQAASTTGCT